jgi:hypothetical protein
MRRNFLSSVVLPSIFPAAILAAGSLWAAPNAAQYLNEINEQTFQIQTQADRLDAYVRSGSRDPNNSAAYTLDMAEGAQKLLALLDQVAAQPGATNDTRLQVKKMKSMTEELMAFTSNARGDVDTRAIALHADNVFANTANIEEHCNMIRIAAQNLLAAR